MNKKTIFPVFVFLTLTSSFLYQGCNLFSSSNPEPSCSLADTVNVTYSGGVSKILSASCTKCHKGSNPDGGIGLDTYTKVQTVANNGKLLGSIKHSSGYSAMPKNASKLSDCNIKKIEKWVQAGAPNN